VEALKELVIHLQRYGTAVVVLAASSGTFEALSRHDRKFRLQLG